MGWLDNLPAWVRLSLFASGFLISAFSGQFPPNLQTGGLVLGLALAGIAVVASVVHWVQERRVTPQAIVAIALFGAAFCLAIAGLGMWQMREPIQARNNSSTAPQRALSPEQKELIAKVLRETSWQAETVWVRYARGCEECRRFANDLGDALTRAGWNDEVSTTLDERHDLVGLKLNVADAEKQPQTARLIASALRQAGTSFEVWPVAGMSPERVTLFVYGQEG